MTLDDSSSVYNLLISSAQKGLKYGLAHSIVNHQSAAPHLFTLSFKLGTKPPVTTTPVFVWFGDGTIKISSFVCLVGIGFGIGSYIVYRICKRVFPIGVNGSLSPSSSSSLLGKDHNNALESDQIKSSSSSDKNQDVEGRPDGNRKHSQTSERHTRRRKVMRTKRSSPSTDSDTDLSGFKTQGTTIDRPPLISGHSSDLGFISMKSSQLQLRTHPSISEDKNSTDADLQFHYNFSDDHRTKRFVVTPFETSANGEERLYRPFDDHLRCSSTSERRRLHSTPDDFRIDDETLDLSELIYSDKTHETSDRSSFKDSKMSDSDSERTGIGSSQPSSEMFETAKDIVLSGTITEMEQLQSQLDLLSNDVDDLNCEMESLQMKEDPKKTVTSRYTLGAEESMTVRKNKESNQKKENKSRCRFLRKLDFQNSLSKENRTKSCDLLGSDRSEDGVVALVENADRTWESDIKSSFLSDDCSELERLSSDGSFCNGLVALSDASNDFIPDEQFLEDLLQPTDGLNKTFVVKCCDSESKCSNFDRKSKKTEFNTTDDLYIDDDLISPSSDHRKQSSKRMSLPANSMLSPQLGVRPHTLTSFDESNSIYQTPERSFAANFPSPWMENEAHYLRRLATMDGQLNLVNNNININLISELLFLSSRDGPLSPQTSNFLSTCLESPTRASANLDVETIHKFMEKIGEAVVNFGTASAPLKKCTGRAFSTPVDSTIKNHPINSTVKNHPKTLRSMVERLRSPFPLWVASNLEEPVEILEYAGKKFCANTESHIYQGYNKISQLIGARNICEVRKDNFCSMRAALCQAIATDKLKSFSQMFKANHKKFLKICEAKDNEYLRSSCFSNRLPFNKGSEMEIIKICFDLLLKVIISQEAIHSEVHDPTQKEEQLKGLLDALFNGCPIIDLHLMEAIKMIMVVEAIELFKSFGSNPIQSKPLAWSIFSGKSTRNPEQLFRNRIAAIGDTQFLNKVEMSLLAHSLRIKLEILKPSLYFGSLEGFVCHHPDEGADDFEKVTLVEEADNAFLLILQ